MYETYGLFRLLRNWSFEFVSDFDIRILDLTTRQQRSSLVLQTCPLPQTEATIFI